MGNILFVVLSHISHQPAVILRQNTPMLHYQQLSYLFVYFEYN